MLNFVSRLDKGETKLLSLIAEHLIENNRDYYHAIEVYRKMGDYKNLVQALIKADQWDEVCYIHIVVVVVGGVNL